MSPAIVIVSCISGTLLLITVFLTRKIFADIYKVKEYDDCFEKYKKFFDENNAKISEQNKSLQEIEQLKDDNKKYYESKHKIEEYDLTHKKYRAFFESWSTRIEAYEGDFEKYKKFYENEFLFVSEQKKILNEIEEFQKIDSSQKGNIFESSLKTQYLKKFGEKEELTKLISEPVIQLENQKTEYADHALIFYKSFEDKIHEKKNFVVMIEDKHTNNAEKQFGMKINHEDLKKTLKKLTFAANHESWKAQYAVLRSNWAINDEEYIKNGIKFLYTKSEYEQYNLTQFYGCAILVFLNEKYTFEFFNLLHQVNLLTVTMSTITTVDATQMDFCGLSKSAVNVIQQIKKVVDACSNYKEESDKQHEALLKTLQNKKFKSRKQEFEYIKDSFQNNFDKLKADSKRLSYFLEPEELEDKFKNVVEIVKEENQE